MASTTHHYVIEIEPKQHRLRCELRLAHPGGPLHLTTPLWVPGAYGLMKYGRDLFEIEVRSAAGKAIPHKRDGWAGIRAEAPAGELHVSWRAVGHDPAWGELSGLIDDRYAAVRATRFLHAPEVPGGCEVEYRIPEGWRSHTPSGGTALSPLKHRYASFLDLLETPFIAGKFELFTREVRGTKFHHLFLDRAVGWDSEIQPFVDRMVKVAERCHDLFGSFPFPNYTWIFSFDPNAHWGLEHPDSTMIGLGDTALIDPEQRNRAVRVAAHELFHAWNVCRLKPMPLGAPRFDRVPTIDSLWVAEGFTRYYEFLLSVRAGELQPEALFWNLLHYHRQLESHPAFSRVSAVDSSRATFLNHNKYPGSVNCSIDYYDAGMLIAFRLDARLRARGTPSLDSQFADFYRAHVTAPEGYRHEDAIHALGIDEEMRHWLAGAVEQPARPDDSVIGTLESLGFKVGFSESKKVGLVMEEGSGKIANLIDTLPAGRSGIAPGDEIQRIDGFPFSAKALNWSLQNRKELSLEVKRGHAFLTYSFAPESVRQPNALSWNGSAAQLEKLSKWVGVSLSWSAGQAIPNSPFENFHGIQAVI